MEDYILKIPNWQKVIAEIYYNENKFSISKLVHKVGCSTSNILSTITKLEELDLITKTGIRTDKRKKILTLTESGKELAKCCFNLLEIKKNLAEKEQNNLQNIDIEQRRFG